MIPFIFVCLFWAAGHVIRDGTPNFGPQRTWLARLVGALLCGIISFMADPQGPTPALLWGASVAAAVYLGFVIDRRHSDGGNAVTWEDAVFAIISGATSAAPIAAVHAIHFHLHDWQALASHAFVFVIAAGLGKALLYWLFGPLFSSERILRWRLQPLAYGAFLGALFQAMS